jgi:hypothetical protein
MNLKTERLSRLTLRASGDRIDDPTLNVILSSPSALSHLTTLTLSDIHTLSDTTLISILTTCSSTLTFLELERLNVGDEGMRGIRRLGGALSQLRIFGCVKWRSFSALVGGGKDTLKALQILYLMKMPELGEGEELRLNPLPRQESGINQSQVEGAGVIADNHADGGVGGGQENEGYIGCVNIKRFEVLGCKGLFQTAKKLQKLWDFDEKTAKVVYE